MDKKPSEKLEDATLTIFTRLDEIIDEFGYQEEVIPTQMARELLGVAEQRMMMVVAELRKSESAPPAGPVEAGA